MLAGVAVVVTVMALSLEVPVLVGAACAAGVGAWMPQRTVSVMRARVVLRAVMFARVRRSEGLDSSWVMEGVRFLDARRGEA